MYIKKLIFDWYLELSHRLEKNGLRRKVGFLITQLFVNKYKWHL